MLLVLFLTGCSTMTREEQAAAGDAEWEHRMLRDGTYGHRYGTDGPRIFDRDDLPGCDRR